MESSEHNPLNYCFSWKQSIYYKYAELDTQLLSAGTRVAAPRRGGKQYVLLAQRIEWDWGEINCGSLEVALLAALALFPPPRTTHWGIIAPPHRRGGRCRH